MATTQFPLIIDAVQGEGHTLPLSVKIEVNDEQPASPVLHYLRSVQVKNDVMNSWVRDNAPGYGMEIKGGPRPVFQTENDRSTPVIAYVQEFRLTRPV